MVIRLRKAKVFLIAGLLLVSATFLVLNVLLAEFNSKNTLRQHHQKHFLPVKDFQMKMEQFGEVVMKSRMVNEFHVDNNAQEQRTKIASIDEDREYVDDKKAVLLEKNFKNSLKDSKKTKEIFLMKLKSAIGNNMPDWKNNDDYDEYDLDKDEDEENYVDKEDEADTTANSDNETNDAYTNQVFKPEDFDDIQGFKYHTKAKLDFEDFPAEKQHEPDSVFNNSLVQGNIFWSPIVEALIPKAKLQNMPLEYLREQAVKKLQKSQWNLCGRPKNAFVLLADRTEMCARYRHPHDKFVYGEALSFHLAQLITMDNVPTVVLSTTNSTSPQWRDVHFSDIDWCENVTVALIKFIAGLRSKRARVYIPPLMLEAYKSGVPITHQVLSREYQSGTNSSKMAHLVQWGSMLIFDYLTGNYDRVASMQDAADKEKRASVILEKIRNLVQSPDDHKFWLIDNESGLFDAYDLLTDKLHMVGEVPRFAKFHHDMLRTTCVFQSSLVKALRQLSNSHSPHLKLWNYAVSQEPLLNRMSTESKEFRKFAQLFPTRLKEVLQWVDHCSQLAEL